MSDSRQQLTVVVLTQGEPSASELWTLRRMDDSGFRPMIVRGEQATDITRKKRLKRLIRDYGWWHVLSRFVGNATLGRWHSREAKRFFHGAFELSDLLQWYRSADLIEKSVPHINSPECRQFLSEQQPDVIIRVSGGIVRQKTFDLARLATLNIHHGMAPAIRGMWSIPWAILENRPEWIGATVHRIDSGIDTGGIYWRGSPQLAPGDTGETLFHRSHLQAVDALIEILGQFASGIEPPAVRIEEPSVYRTAPGFGPWLRYQLCGSGSKSRLLLERAIR